MNGVGENTRGSDPVHDGINSHGLSCFVSAATPVGTADLRRFAAALMTAIAAASVAAGAKDVSHVKAFIEHASGFLHADTVGVPGDVKVEGRDGGPAADFSLVVNAVIYGLSAEAVEEVTETAVDATIKLFGFVRTSGTN